MKAGAYSPFVLLRPGSEAGEHMTPALTYQHGQRVWLSSRDLPLQTKSSKLAPRFVGLFEVDQVVNTAAVLFGLTLCSLLRSPCPVESDSPLVPIPAASALLALRPARSQVGFGSCLSSIGASFVVFLMCLATLFSVLY